MAASSLAQIIGIEQGVRGSAEPWWKTAAGMLTKEALLNGAEASYEPVGDNVPLPRQSALIQVNATEFLAEFRQKMGRYLDVTATKDWGNTGTGGARADVVLDGTVVIADAPATFLLFLDKRLEGFQADFRKIVTQTLADDWQESTDRGIWRTEQARRPQMSKIQDFKVVVDPTPEHRAEIREISRDAIAGWWTTVKTTSAIPARQLRQILDNLAALREAVQVAIHEANKVTVEDVKVSAQILGAIFAGAE